jgi:hypothetical protein
MPSASRHISERIDRPVEVVYAYAVDPSNLPEWATGLAEAVEIVDARWYVDTPTGRVGFSFVERNPFGVLDHVVTLGSGETVFNPMRLIPDGDGCEAVFTLRRTAGASDDDFERDARAVAADLARLKSIVEARSSA